MPLLEAQNLSKSFGALRAVDGVSFSVERGEILGIAGPNGSGKSTLFNLLTHIPYGPDSGEIRFDDRPLRAMPAERIARAGMVRTFQREICFESLSVMGHVELAAASTGADQQDAEAALAALDFTTADHARPGHSLTVFERKRLMIASALACRPKMILLDEPASGLTKPEIEVTARYIGQIAQGGIAVLLIEHVLPLLMRLSERIMVLSNGKVIALGDPQEVMRDERVIEAYLGSRRPAA